MSAPSERRWDEEERRSVVGERKGVRMGVREIKTRWTVVVVMMISMYGDGHGDYGSGGGGKADGGANGASVDQRGIN
jgi:hypothetical protein